MCNYEFQSVCISERPRWGCSSTEHLIKQQKAQGSNSTAAVGANQPLTLLLLIGLKLQATRGAGWDYDWGDLRWSLAVALSRAHSCAHILSEIYGHCRCYSHLVLAFEIRTNSWQHLSPLRTATHRPLNAKRSPHPRRKSQITYQSFGRNWPWELISWQFSFHSHLEFIRFHLIFISAFFVVFFWQMIQHIWRQPIRL